MASDDTMTVLSSMHEEDDDEDDQPHHPSHTMSRLAFCTSSSQHSLFDEDDDDDMILDMSRLYVEEEEEEEEEDEDEDEDEEVDGELSGKEGSVGSETGWFSLPGSPFGGVGREVKEYASENEGRRGERRLAVRGRRWVERAWEMRKCKAADEEMESSNGNNYPSGESESVVIAMPKGGGRCLSMDMEEVKACRELGFDLQHAWTLEIPTRFSPSSAADTDSEGNSPITNWKISSAGDDPKDVKARLKVWAQAVALASTHRLTG